MAKIEPLGKFILSWEGGFVNDPQDRGGATNKGVTIATWKAQGYDKDGDGDIDVQDLKLITNADAINVMKKNYWNRWQADKIVSQPIANILVDWVWGSGAWGIKIPQQMLGCKADGVVGAKTLAALNKQNPAVFFNNLKTRRTQYLNNLCSKNPSQKKFLIGWLRRLNSIQYTKLVCNGGRVITW
ncbi:MAG: glycoside hydrolase family 108 protein [Prevotella sp.]